MTLTEIQNQFLQVRDSTNQPEIFKFISALTTSHDEKTIDYHYSLFKEGNMSKELYDQLSRGFTKHGEAGEVFLLGKIKTETDFHIKGTILQILGGMKYSNGKHLTETTKLAREWLNSDQEFLRNRATIVLGWLGDLSDVQVLKERFVQEKDDEIRGWTASALMQLYFNNEAVKKKKALLLDILKNALSNEENDFALSCILVSIQEITGEKLGLSAKNHETPAKDKLEKAKSKVLKLT